MIIKLTIDTGVDETDKERDTEVVALLEELLEQIQQPGGLERVLKLLSPFSGTLYLVKGSSIGQRLLDL